MVGDDGRVVVECGGHESELLSNEVAEREMDRVWVLRFMRGEIDGLL